MRIAAPIIPATQLSPEQVGNVLIANFHTALDARYAVTNGLFMVSALIFDGIDVWIYSATGAAWAYFSHQQFHGRAYRWGEDGLGGICGGTTTRAFSTTYCTCPMVNGCECRFAPWWG